MKKDMEDLTHRFIDGRPSTSFNKKHNLTYFKISLDTGKVTFTIMWIIRLFIFIDIGLMIFYDIFYHNIRNLSPFYFILKKEIVNLMNLFNKSKRKKLIE